MGAHRRGQTLGADPLDQQLRKDKEGTACAAFLILAKVSLLAGHKGVQEGVAVFLLAHFPANVAILHLYTRPQGRSPG